MKGKRIYLTPEDLSYLNRILGAQHPAEGTEELKTLRSIKHKVFFALFTVQKGSEQQ